MAVTIMKLTSEDVKKILDLGFMEKEYNGKKAFVLRRNPLSDRRCHDFVIYSDKQMHIYAHKRKEISVITEEKVMENHNNLNPGVKDTLEKIKPVLVGIGVNILS